MPRTENKHVWKSNEYLRFASVICPSPLPPTHKQYMKTKALCAALTAFMAVSLLFNARADITTGLVGYWKFDEGSGSSAADSSTNVPPNTGTLTQFADTSFTSMWTTDAWFGDNLLFNQNNETTNYVSIPNAASLNFESGKQWTVAAWVKLSATGTSGAIISKGQNANQYNYLLDYTGTKFHVKMRNSGNTGGSDVNSGTTPKAGTWYHVAGTYNRNGSPKLVIYVNGVTNGDSGGDTYTTLYATTHAVTIGNRQTGAGGPYNAPFLGNIDDAHIYNRALSASDVLELYSNNAPGSGHVPAIATQPHGVNCYSNDTAVFSVGVVTTNSYVPVSYQWQLNGSDIASATTSRLTLPNVAGDDAGTYTVVLTNYAGSITSTPAILALQSLPAPDTTTGLVGWWKFDDANGSATAADSSGNGSTGALTNFVEGTFTNMWGMGIDGGDLSFNGDFSGSNVVVVPSLGAAAPAVLDFSASPVFTLAAWVKASLTQSNQAGILAKGTGSGGEQYCLDLNAGNFRFFVRDASGVSYSISSSVPINGFWQHVAGVVNATNGIMNLYVNGALVAAAVAPTSLLANSHEVSIGNRQASTTDYNYPFTGAIDDVRIYSRDLTSADISALFGEDAYPIITQQYPVTYTNLFTLYAGSSITLRIPSVTGLGLSYQWYTNGVADPGATGTSYPLSNLPVGGFTNYYCIVTNSRGSGTSFVWSASVVAQPTAPYAQSVLSLNPVGYWRLSEADDGLNDGNPGAVLHDYVGGNNGIYTNATLGQVGYAQALSNLFGYYPASDPESSAQFANFPYFGASDSYAGQIQGIDFGVPNGATTNFTVECWVAGIGALPSAATILSKGIYSMNDAWSFSVDTTTARKYRFSIRTASGTVITATSAVAADYGTWHHLVGMLDETDGLVKFYIDGTNAASATVGTTAGAYASAANPMTIGSAQNNTRTGPYTLQYNGYVNDVALYNYALSDAQIQANYLAAGFPPKITQQPVSSTNVNEGTTLSVPAQGGGGTPPVVTQWYDVSAGVPGTPLDGQTNNTLVVSNISAALYNNHSFALSVSNAYGHPYSSSVYVMVSSGAPSVTVNPSAITVYANAPVVFSATAQGTEPFSYQWSTNSTPVPDATNATYTCVAGLGSVTVSCTMTGPGGNGSSSGTVTGIAHPSDSYAVGILADQPAAYWRLDEPLNAAVAYDYVGGHYASYNNVTNGLPGFSPSNPDTAAGFGMNGFTSFSMALEQRIPGVSPIDFSTQGTNAEFSVEAWVKAPAGSGGGIVTRGYGHGEQFNLDISGGFRWRVRDAGGNPYGPTSTVLPDGNWHQVVGVCDQANGMLSLYIDGALSATTTFPVGAGTLAPLPDINGNPVLTSIGSRMSANTDTSYSLQLSNSVVDEVAIYNYPLSSNQVAGHYTTAAMPPLIVQDLQSQMYAYVGFPLSLSVQATSSTPMSYQWQRNGTNLVDGGDISGSQTNTLTLGIQELGDSGTRYQVFVTNQATSFPAVSTLAAVTVLPQLQFNGFGGQWTSQGAPATVPKYTAANVLRLIDGGASEAGSSFFSYPVYVGGFQATFTYQDVGGGGADGAAFVVQNDSRRATARGGGGGGFGYNGITNSAALEFNIYANNTVGYAFRTNGLTGKPYTSASPVNIASGDPINVTLLYANGVISMTLTDAVVQTSFTTDVSLDIPAAVGGTMAYVGFTGGDGSVVSTQTVSDFTFVSLPVLDIQPAAGSNVTLTWPTAIGSYVLQESPGVAPSNWTNVSTLATNFGGFYQVTLPAPGSSSFYRLISTP